MTLFQDALGDPRAAEASLADVLAWYGALGDAAAGDAPGLCTRKAAVAVALCEVAQVSDAETSATHVAGVLHAVGAIGNAAYRKNSALGEREARMHRSDVPAQGARIAAGIAALPEETADLIRWQAECWDGTGFPDQLRWHGIPQCAQFLALADAFVRYADAEEALGAIGMQSGRAFGPQATRAFVTWFHSTGGEAAAKPFPSSALRTELSSAEEQLDAIADRIDDHNGVPGRWRRIERLVLDAGSALGCEDGAIRTLRLASRLYGSGELSSPDVEDSRFDPLARLGIDVRADHAQAAAGLAGGIASFADARAIIAARAEWYDGTGKPSKLMHRNIPLESRVLSAAIAYEAVDRTDRLDTAAGTQFDPLVVRALLAPGSVRA